MSFWEFAEGSCVGLFNLAIGLVILYVLASLILGLPIF